MVEFIHERQTETVPGEWSEVVEVVNEGQPEAPAGDVVFTIECDNGQAADPGVTGEKQTEEITIEEGKNMKGTSTMIMWQLPSKMKTTIMKTT